VIQRGLDYALQNAPQYAFSMVVLDAGGNLQVKGNWHAKQAKK
jgi:hypothetical protein